MNAAVIIPAPAAEFLSVANAAAKIQRDAMLRIRQMVYEVAHDLKNIGEIEESLKWGEPAFSTIRPKSGSPFRVAPVRGSGDKIGLYFICTTTLVSQFCEHYGDELVIEGNRAIILNCNEPLPEEQLNHCMAMALTYRLDRFTARLN